MVYRMKYLGYEFSSECFYFIIIFFSNLELLNLGCSLSTAEKPFRADKLKPRMTPILGMKHATLVGGGWGCSHHCTITALEEIANQKLYLEEKFRQQQ